MSDDFKFNPANVKPLSEVDAPDGLQPTQKPPAPVAAASVHLTDIDLEIQKFIEGFDPRNVRLGFLASVLRLPIFWDSLYWERKDGWGFENKQTRARTSLTFDEVDALIDARCEELGIDRALVEAWGGSRHSIAESQAFDRLPVQERIQRFRKSQAR